MFDSRQLSWCAEEVRRHDNDRFLTALFAPEPEREALFALYAFNVEIARVREAAREPLVAAIRLAWWRDALTSIYSESESPHHPVAEALHAVIARYDLPRALFDQFIETRARDLEDVPNAGMDSLVAYAEGTGGALAELAATILGAKSESARAAGRAVGTAWALTGLVRAVPFHAHARRLYLPKDRLDALGISAEAVFSGDVEASLAPVVRVVAGEAHARLSAARQWRAKIGRAAVPALLLARIADLHLKRLAAVGYNPFDRRLDRPLVARHLRVAFAALLGRY